VDALGSEGKWKNLRGRRFQDIVPPEDFAQRLTTERYKGVVSGILHMGAITDTSEPDADALFFRNTRYTRSLALWAMDNNVRFVYASSASVYGDGALGFSDDDALTPRLLPMNPYAFSKWLLDVEAIREFDAECIRNEWTDEIAGLRFFNVFGPNEYHKGRMASVVWHATNQVRDTGKMQLFESHKDGYGNGEQRRDFISVKDVCDVVLWFLDNPKANGVFNVGTGQARSFNDLASAIFAALGKPRDLTYVPTPENIRASYQYFTEADLAKLRGASYDKPFTSLEDAVCDYITGYLQDEANPYL